MAVWLSAWFLGVEQLPRRLVYVVDRRAVVDQATDEADKLATTWAKLTGTPLPISTLRGQHADNRAWLADPAAPAIIVGTVDMIGSRLLFEGYGVSHGMRPNQAALLGVDSLLVLDESHLCPPFEALLRDIEQAFNLRGETPEAAELIRPLRLLSLTLTEVDERAKPEEALATAARDLAAEAPFRVLVFCHSRALALKVRIALGKDWPRGERPKIDLLVGARRGREREWLAERLREGGWLGGGERRLPAQSAFLVATSAGEVGVDLDADHMVCDLVAAERMIQRLGRVNRRGGDGRVARIRVLVLLDDKKSKLSDEEANRLKAVRDLLAKLPPMPDDEEGGWVASPWALAGLQQAHPDLMAEASTPKPLRPELTRALVDGWSLTSLRDHPGRPRPDPWLRGWQEKDRPQSTLLWRRWLPWYQHGDGATDGPPDPTTVNEYLAVARPHPAELLEIWTDDALAALVARAKSVALPKSAAAVLVFSRARDYETHFTVGDLRNMNRKRWGAQLSGQLLVISARLGGIDTDGMLSDKADGVLLTEPCDPGTDDEGGEEIDVRHGGWAGCLDDGWPDPELDALGVPIRVLPPGGKPPEDDTDRRTAWRMPWSRGDADAPDWLQVEVRRKPGGAEAGDPAVRRREQRLAEHHDLVAQEAARIAADLRLPDSYKAMLAAASRWHDSGKKRRNWQLAMNAPCDGHAYAKTKGGGNLNLLRINGEVYRHEFGSLADAETAPDIVALPEPLRDLALHLIATHHGHARPLITQQDPDDHSEEARQRRAYETALRFARLQRSWGPWGLAWWEGLLRAADRAASARLDDEGST
jgi:CRISPR-associated endonuclease/helicase Cas3